MPPSVPSSRAGGCKAVRSTEKTLAEIALGALGESLAGCVQGKNIIIITIIMIIIIIILYIYIIYILYIHTYTWRKWSEQFWKVTTAEIHLDGATWNGYLFTLDKQLEHNRWNTTCFFGKMFPPVNLTVRELETNGPFSSMIYLKWWFSVAILAYRRVHGMAWKITTQELEGWLICFSQEL